MSRQKYRVVAAIPAYNEEKLLGGLLDQVLDQEYDDVYVLDDASTDATVEVASFYGKDVNVIEGKENVGSGANRNRIIPKLGGSAIIHFIDADIHLNTDRSPERVREVITHSDIGFVGGLVRNPDGSQHPWNYGPAFSLPQMLSSWAYTGINRLAKTDPVVARALRSSLNRWTLMEQWPDPQKEPRAREVYWACEANLVIPSDVFVTVGGYDPNLRYHEVMELAMRLEQLGLNRRFDPLIDVTHQNLEWLNKGYTHEFWSALVRTAGKIGIKEFMAPSKKY